MAALRALGIEVRIHEMPNEIADAMPLLRGPRARAPTTRDAAQRFWRVLLAGDRVFTHFRTGFLGKASPVHFFWGSFDLAVTRFSGRRAPPHPGGVPNLPDAVTREAYSHEVTSAGFWPGGGADRLSGVLFVRLSGAGGFCRGDGAAGRGVLPRELGEFILPYDAVRTAQEPERDAAGVPADHLRGRGGCGEVGPRGAGVWIGGEGEGEGGVIRLMRTFQMLPAR